MQEYRISTPSIDGVLGSSHIVYGDIVRPLEILKVLDGPRSKGGRDYIKTEKDQKLMLIYFQDLQILLNKKLAEFISDASYDDTEAVKIQALVQELVKVKKLTFTDWG
jgi:hypothetical protein